MSRFDPLLTKVFNLNHTSGFLKMCVFFSRNESHWGYLKMRCHSTQTPFKKGSIFSLLTGLSCSRTIHRSLSFLSLTFQHCCVCCISWISSLLLSALGRLPSPHPAICDWTDGRQRQRKDLHCQAAGSSGCSSHRLRQTRSRSVPEGNRGLSQSTGSLWVRWETVRF